LRVRAVGIANSDVRSFSPRRFANVMLGVKFKAELGNEV